MFGLQRRDKHLHKNIEISCFSDSQVKIIANSSRLSVSLQFYFLGSQLLKKTNAFNIRYQSYQNLILLTIRS